MTTGMVLGLSGVLFQQIVAADPTVIGPMGAGPMAFLQTHLYQIEPVKTVIVTLGSLDGQRLTFFNALCCITVYVVVSLLTYNRNFNLDKMLHRGEYAIADDTAKGDVIRGPRLYRWLGINDSFTRTDRVIYLTSVGWVLFWGVVFFVGLLMQWLTGGIADSSWMTFWGLMMLMSLVLGAVTTVWFSVGGFINMKEMFQMLRTRVRDADDDGTVHDENETTEPGKNA